MLGQGAAAAQKLNAYTWTVGCPAGGTANEAATLTFDSWVGLNLGTFTTGATAAAPGTGSISTTGAPVTVHQNPEAGDPTTASQIQPNTLVVGHIASTGEQAFYKVNLGNLPQGTRFQAFLNVPSNADLDLTISAPAAPPFFSTPVGSTPVGSTPIEDNGVGFAGLGQGLSPDTLQDVPVGSTPVGSTPVGSTPVGSTSDARGDGVNEAGTIITSGQGGFATIGVSGYNGATSTTPFVLRVQETPPPALPACPARTFPNGAPSSFAPGTLPTSIATSRKTLFIVDKQRLTALYGATAVTNLLNSLNTLAARSEVLPTGVEPTGVEPTGVEPTGTSCSVSGNNVCPSPAKPTPLSSIGVEPTGVEPTGMEKNGGAARSADREIEVGVRRHVEERLQARPLRQVAEVHLVESLLAGGRDMTDDEGVRLDLARGRRVARLGVLVDGDRAPAVEIEPAPGAAAVAPVMKVPRFSPTQESRSTSPPRWPSTRRTADRPRVGIQLLCCRRSLSEHARGARARGAPLPKAICAEPSTGKKPAGRCAVNVSCDTTVQSTSAPIV